MGLEEIHAPPWSAEERARITWICQQPPGQLRAALIWELWCSYQYRIGRGKRDGGRMSLAQLRSAHLRVLELQGQTTLVGEDEQL